MPTSKILTLGSSLLLLACSACSTTPRGRGMQNRIESQQRIDGHKAHLDLEQAHRAYTNGMFDKAMKLAEQARRRIPSDPRSYMLLARICLEQGRLESCDRLLGEVISLDPTIPDAHYLRGIVFQRWSRDPQALEAYLTALELDPDSRHSVHYLLAAGETLVDMQRFEEARSLLLPRIGFHENNAAMHHLLGTISVLVDDDRSAIRHLRQAHLIGGDDQIIMADLARAQLDGSHFRECLRTLEELQSSMTGAIPSWLYELRARCYLEMGSPRDARSTYVQLLRVDPDNIQAWIDYGATAHEIGDLGRLDTCGDRLISLAPGRIEGFLFKGVAALESMDLASARAWFTRSNQLAPSGQAIPLLALAQLEMLDGNVEEARRLCIKAIRERNDSTSTRRYVDAIASGSLEGPGE
ncbi:MAG: tetratricopeptide repeat protein [Planctomycetota bacterium]|nr:tetratricopeptide repeat protein [Planctomycetota bacterium]